MRVSRAHQPENNRFQPPEPRSTPTTALVVAAVFLTGTAVLTRDWELAVTVFTAVLSAFRPRVRT